jgi:hypothetical protein
VENADECMVINNKSMYGIFFQGSWSSKKQFSLLFHVVDELQNTIDEEKRNFLPNNEMI